MESWCGAAGRARRNYFHFCIKAFENFYHASARKLVCYGQRNVSGQNGRNKAVSIVKRKSGFQVPFGSKETEVSKKEIQGQMARADSLHDALG